jgi:hypothetical protein
MFGFNKWNHWLVYTQCTFQYIHSFAELIIGVNNLCGFLTNLLAS